MPGIQSPQRVDPEAEAIFEYRVTPPPEFCRIMLHGLGNFEMVTSSGVREKMRRTIDGLHALHRDLANE